MTVRPAQSGRLDTCSRVFRNPANYPPGNDAFCPPSPKRSLGDVKAPASGNNIVSHQQARLLIFVSLAVNEEFMRMMNGFRLGQADETVTILSSELRIS